MICDIKENWNQLKQKKLFSYAANKIEKKHQIIFADQISMVLVSHTMQVTPERTKCTLNVCSKKLL
jgi:hypothetical protein